MSTIADIYDPTNPNFINPNDVLALHPNDAAAQQASVMPAVVYATQLRSVTLQVAALNAMLTSLYLAAFDSWLGSWTGGRITDKTTAPVPPAGYLVSRSTDEAGDMLTGAAVGTVAVCAQPAIPEQPAPQVHPVWTGNATLMNVPAGDTMPIGSIIPSPDGGKWQKMASPTPFGMAYYYAKVG
ncbi:MAG TPA: hypothetical protein VNY05_12315 [Candidatus Acidoferrales bacterium]|jgi:hypothetical protein|nr:hypothetical protein [Candidatus Acidoferrales bacterium]